jgi:predicted hydrolase (HD superfamily)
MPDDNGKRSETAMNHSIYSADPTTHMKIVAVALVAGIGIAGFGIAARVNRDDGYAQTAHVIKTKTRIQNKQFALALPPLRIAVAGIIGLRSNLPLLLGALSNETLKATRT